MKKNFDYTKSDIIKKLKKISVQKDDSIFVQSNLGFFGVLKDANNAKAYCQIFKDAIFEVIGLDGTLVVPTFSFSFCNNQIYNKKKTPSVECGIFSEFIRCDSKSERSCDANFSIAAIGKNAKKFTSNLSEYSFGKNSFWERFLLVDGKLCRFNLPANYMSFIHFVEKSCNVPYRFDKPFLGKSIINNREVSRKFFHFVRDLDNDNHSAELSRLEDLAIKQGLMKVSTLGRGSMYGIRSKDFFDLAKQELEKNPSFLIKGKI